MSDLNKIIHGPKEGLIDIKPITVSSSLIEKDYLLLFLLLIIVALFAYILFLTLKGVSSKKTNRNFTKEALDSLQTLSISNICTKDYAEGILKVIKNFIFNLGFRDALSLDSSMSRKKLERFLRHRFSNISDESRDKISNDICTLLEKLEFIEYSSLENISATTPVSDYAILAQTIISNLSTEQKIDSSLHKQNRSKVPLKSKEAF